MCKNFFLYLILRKIEEFYLVFIIFCWALLFKNGKETPEDDPHSGFPITELIQDNIEAVSMVVMVDPH